MFIEDGQGNGNIAGVNGDGQLLASAITEPSYSNAAIDASELYAWTSQFTAGGAARVFYLKNTDPNKYLRINRVIASSTVAQLWDMNRITGGTPAGTIITGVNTNFTSGKVAQALAYGDAAVTGTLTVQRLNIAYATIFSASLDGSIILPVNTAIGISCSAAGGIAIMVSGYYQPIV